ncbi:MAG: MFS transporter [Bacteroidia bacterium]|nr:MFS transporter [Bacteroidia bacterium]
MRAAVFLTVWLDVLSAGILLPVISPLIFQSEALFSAEVGFGPRTMLLGWMGTMFCVGQFLGAPVLGAWSDRVGRRRAFIATAAVATMGVAATGLGFYVGSRAWVLTGRLIYGLGSGNAAIAYSALADISNPQTRSRDFGLVGAAYGLGFILGPWLGGQLAGISVWAAFILAAALHVFNILFVAFLFRETLGVQPSPRPMSPFTGIRNVAFAFRHPRLRLLFVVVIGMQFGFAFFTQFFPMFLIRKFDYGPQNLGAIFGYMGFWMALTQGVVNRRVSYRTPPGRIVRIVLFAGAAALFSLTLPQTSTWIYAALAATAFSQGLILPNLASLVSMQAGAEFQGEIMGVHQSCVSAAQAFPPLIAGIWAADNPDFPLWAAACAYVFAGLTFVSTVYPALRPPAR